MKKGTFVGFVFSIAIGLTTAGFVPAYALQVGDRVWLDTNQNGLQDTNEIGLEGVNVNLMDCNENILASTTTDPSGNFFFVVQPDDYKILFSLPESYNFSPVNWGNDDTVDSDANPGSGMTDCTTLNLSHDNLTLDAGVYRLMPSIDIETYLNNEDADFPPGPELLEGKLITWLYEITNTGNETLFDVVVFDNKLGSINCPQSTLAVSESMTCSAMSVSEAGQYESIAIASAKGLTVSSLIISDEDPNYYFGLNNDKSEIGVADQITGNIAYDHLIYFSDVIGSREAGSYVEQEASAYIAHQFVNIGYDVEIQPFVYELNGIAYESANIIATKPGKSDRTIIVGAHYDSVPEEICEISGITEESNGSGDNASGVGVMLEIAEVLGKYNSKATIKFIAFGGKEVGLKGSSYYADQMTEKEIEDTAAMINLDAVASGDYFYVYSGIDNNPIWLRSLAIQIGKNLGYDLRTSPESEYFEYGTTGDWSDHVPFRLLGIPIAYFEWMNWDIEPNGGLETEEFGWIMHTCRDNINYADFNKLHSTADVAGSLVFELTQSNDLFDDIVLNLGDDVLLGENVTISKNVTAVSGLVVGNGSTIDQGVSLGRNVKIGDNVNIAKNVAIGDNVTIGDYTTIEQGVIIKDDVNIGTNVVIERGVTVKMGSDVPHFEFIPQNTEYPSTSP